MTMYILRICIDSGVYSVFNLFMSKMCKSINGKEYENAYIMKPLKHHFPGFLNCDITYKYTLDM